MDYRYVIHAALSGLLALPDENAETIIDRLTPDALLCLEDQLLESEEELLWLREVNPVGTA
jgi:hypothetical protein